VNALRARQKRNCIATLMLSQGVPMMLGGDELDRTQRGNNNAYCQDNEVSWFDWTMTPERERLLQFFARMIKLRRQHPIFHRRTFFQGRPIRGSDVKDVIWLTPKGEEMTDSEWRESQARSLAVYLSGQGLSETDDKGRPLTDDTFLVLFNSHDEQVFFRLPQFERTARWLMIMDTAYEHGLERGGVTPAGGVYTTEARSIVLLLQQKARD
jgi:glycogen operon protein